MNTLYAVVGWRVWPEGQPITSAFAMPMGRLFTDRTEAAELAQRLTAAAEKMADNLAYGPSMYAVARVEIIEDDPHDVPDTEGD